MSSFTNAPSVPPVVHVSDAWRVFPGYGHGLSQAAMCGQLQLQGLEALDAAALNTLFLSLLGRLGPLRGVTDRPENPGQWVEWLVRWSHQLLELSRIPVFAQPQVTQEMPDASRPGMVTFKVLLPYHTPESSLTALAWVSHVVNGAADTNVSASETWMRSVAAVVQRIHHKLRSQGVKGINTNRLLRVAHDARMPYEHLESNTFVVGQGYRSRWLDSTFTDVTSHLGAMMAQNKVRTAAVLAKCGLPVAVHALVTTEDDAAWHAQAIGYPVVVKPADLDGGIGVHAGLVSDAQVRRCYLEARQHSPLVLVEKFHVGRDFRLTVFNGRLIKAIERIPGGVTGDGVRNIQTLVADGDGTAASVQRAIDRGKQMLTLDAEAHELLSGAGLGPDSVPEAGRRIVLRRRANVSTGGTTQLVTAQVHPDNRLLAERAARALRLDMAGIDLLIPNIQQSWLETGAIVCEVNAQPQVGDNNSPGLYRNFLASVLEGDGRIPVALVLVQPCPLARALSWAHAFSRGQSGTVLAWNGMMILDGQRWGTAGQSYANIARATLLCRDAERVLLVATPAQVAEVGLPSTVVDAVAVMPDAHPGPNPQTMGDQLGALILPHLRGLLLCASQDAMGARMARLHPADRTQLCHPTEMDQHLLQALSTTPGMLREQAT